MNSHATRTHQIPEFLTLTCPTCGAKLKLADNINLLVCASCGNEHMVHRDGGSIYLAPMAQDVRQIRVGTDKTAAELAIPRLTKELVAFDEELAAVRVRSYFHKTKQSALEGWLACGTILSLVLATIATFAGSLWVGLAMGIAMLALCVWYGSETGKRYKEADRQRDADLNRLQQQYNAKSSALAKNHQIANS